jgi:Gluconate 2-dehydrogenase subunit 3
MDSSRRSFITSSGQVLGAGWLALNWPGITAAATHAHAAAASPAARSIAILTAEQARDVDAIASQIIPTDDTPGAHESGAVYFIDGALAGFFAGHRDEFHSGYSEFTTAFAKDHPDLRFADLVADRQIEFLKSVDKTPFFDAMRFLTILGLLASPSYGGNRDGIGWKLIGFDDQHVFQPPFGYYDRDYPGFVPYPDKARS